MDLFKTAIWLGSGGAVDVSPRQSLGEVPAQREWVVVALRADTDRAVHRDVWERHPAGQEVLCVLSGALSVYVRDHGGGHEPTATVSAGEAFVVPRGAWHRLSVVQPGDLLALTPPAGTEHQPVPGPPVEPFSTGGETP